MVMVGFKVQTLFAFWALTHFSYLSHADDELHCPIPQDFSGRVDKFEAGMRWMICKGSTQDFLLTCYYDERLKNYYERRTCKELLCPVPQDFSGKTYMYSDGDEVVACGDGYFINMFACPKSLHEDYHAPSCKDTCGELPAMERIEPSESASNRSYVVGTDIKLRCKDGYQPEPGKTDVASCRLNGSVGSWVMPTIQCRRCPEPPKIDNGRFEFKNPNYRTSVTYHCNSGYDLEGHNEISCQENDTWTGGQNPATCVIISCPPPPNLPNGFVSAPSLEWKAKATYKCNLGFVLIGPKTRVCLANKSWSKEEIICQEPRCPFPMDFPGDIDVFAESELLFTCRNSSFKVIIRCFDTGKWLSPAPNCKGCKLDVNVPDTKYNAKYNDTLPSDGIFPYFTYLKFECDSGYKLTGKPVSVCQVDETWKPPIPWCISGVKIGSLLPPKPSIENVVFLFMFCLLIFCL